MARYVGLDIHKAVIEAAIVDAAGAVLHRARFRCTREQLAKVPLKPTSG